MKSTTTQSGNSLGLTISTGIVLLFIVGLIFSMSRSTSDIVRDADALHDADEALRGITVVRAQVELVALQSAIRANPTPEDRAAIQSGVDEVKQALVTSRVGITAMTEHDSSTASLIALAESFLEKATLAIAAIDSNLHPDLTDFRISSDRLVVQVAGTRSLLADAVTDTDRSLTSLGTLASFLVAFAIPAGIMVVYRELSRRHARQTELEVHLDAERSVNAGREQFISTASHELRSPLTSVLGMAHLLAESEEIMSDPDAAEMVRMMIDEAQDLSRLVEDLLTASRIEAGAIHFSYEDVDVTEEVEAVASIYETTEFTLESDIQHGTVRVDRLRLRQMVRNLVSNARKYGGSNIEVVGRKRLDTYVLSVVDDGPGVPDEIAERLFERFVHRGNESAGTQAVGLGLSIVMAFAVGMGGTVFYERKDERTFFSIVLPLALVVPAELAGAINEPSLSL